MCPPRGRDAKLDGGRGAAARARARASGGRNGSSSAERQSVGRAMRRDSRASSRAGSSRPRPRSRGAERWRRRRTPRRSAPRAFAADRSWRPPREIGARRRAPCRSASPGSCRRRARPSAVSRWRALAARSYGVEIATAAATGASRPLLAQPLEQHVAAEGDADRERAALRGSRAASVRARKSRSAGLAGVVEPRPAVREACATGSRGSRAQDRKFIAVPLQPRGRDLRREAPGRRPSRSCPRGRAERSPGGCPPGPSTWSTSELVAVRASRELSRRIGTRRRQRVRRPQTVWAWGPGSHQAGPNAAGPDRTVSLEDTRKPSPSSDVSSAV